MYRFSKKETRKEILNVLYIVTRFIIELNEIMKTTKYYNRSWMLKDVLDLVNKIDKHKYKFSNSLIKELDYTICGFTDCVFMFLLKDETECKKEVESYKEALVDEKLYEKIDKEIENIKNKMNSFE